MANQPQKQISNSLTPFGHLFTFAFILISTASFLAVLFFAPTQAATTSTLNFQGRLLQSSGAIVPDGYYNIQFKLYDGGTDGGPGGTGEANAGTNLWTESYYDSNGVTAGNDNRLRVVNGYFSANLGSQTAFGSIDWDQELWLTMNVGGTTQTATPTYDGEMLAPGNKRTKLTGVPYAFKAGTAFNVASNNTNQASTNSSNVLITTGNAAGATSNSGNITLDVGTATQTTGTISIGTTNASAITIGNATFNPSFTLDTGTGTIAIGTGAQARTINIGTGAAAQTLTLGSLTSTSTTTIQSGTGNINLQASGPSTIGIIQIGAGGAGSATPDFLALDVKSTTGDPAGGAEGYMYYNTFDNKFRCYQNAGWTDCIGAGGAGTLQGAYDGGNTITTTDARDISFTLANTATDSNFLINIAASSASELIVQNNGTDVLQIGSAGQLQLDVQGSAGGLLLGTDVQLFRGAADRLDLASGDSLNLVSGALQIAGTEVISSGRAISNVTGYAQSSGNFSISGAGTFATGTGTVSLNGDTSVTGANTLTVGTGATTLGGTLTVNGSQFTNTGATLNTAASLGDFPTGGSIGSAATTVDVKTAFAIAQTTTGQTLTLASPTTATAGRIVYILNTGSAEFTMYGIDIAIDTAQSYIWDGAAWIPGSAAAGGGGTVNDLQDAYDGSVGSTTPEIKLDTTRNGLDIQDADSTIAGSLLTVRGSNGSGLGTALFDVTSTGQTTVRTTTNSTTGFRIQNAAGENVLTMDTTGSTLTVGVDESSNGRITFLSSGVGITDPYIEANATGDLLLAATDGSVIVGSGSGNIELQLSTEADLLLADKTATITGAYSSTDFSFTRNLTNTVNTQTLGGNVLSVTDTSTAQAGTTINYDLLFGNAAPTGSTFTGNLLRLQTSGTDQFIVSATGAVSGLSTLTGSGTFNTTGGAIQTNSTDRITNAGGLTNITGYTQSSGNFSFTGSGTFDASGTGTISLGTSTAVQTINLGTGGTGAKTVTLGSTASTGATTIQSGTGNITLQAGGTGTTAVIQIGAGGAGSATPDFLALDVKSDTGDPAGGAEGYMYYNTFDNKFRCYQNAGWTDCIGTGGGGTLQQSYDAGSAGDQVIQLSTTNDSIIIRNPSSSGSDSTYSLTIDQLSTGTSGGLDIQSAGTGNLLRVRDTTATAADVLTIADGGATTFRSQTNSTTAFEVQNASSHALLSIDSSLAKINVGGGATTAVLVLDNATSDPTGYAGAMYYDSAGNRFRCYTTTWVNCDTTGAGGGGDTRIVRLVPEFPGAVLNADGSNNSGSIFSDFVSGLSAGDGEKHNYYEWSTSQSTAQDYSIILNVPIPSEYASMGAASTFNFWLYDGDGSSTNAKVNWEVRDDDETSCFASDFNASASNDWEQISASTLGSCSFAADDTMTVIFKVFTTSSAGVIRIGEMEFSYTN